MERKPRNFTLPSTPMYELIVGPAAAALVGKNVRIRGNDKVKCAFESKFGEGTGNENLELSHLPPGIMGFIIGTANPKTVLRFLVTDEAMGAHPGVYHVKYIDLELVTDSEFTKENP